MQAHNGCPVEVAMETGVAQERFGRLEWVDLRELWPKEAYDFTPWLADNLERLGEALGMDLELQGHEAAVGPYSLDLLAHDLSEDRIVIIENQIEATDHDHLGKLLTYAAGHDASVVVWIALRFREEHREALDWLNHRSDATTAFFGVVVEALQIDGSRPAPHFRPVAYPNDWRKANVSKNGQKSSSKGEAYREFFQGLIDQLREEHSFTNARKGQAQNWYTFSSGVRGLTYGVAFSLGSQVRSEVYIDGGNAEWNKRMFDALYQRRQEIEAAYGESLEWERLHNRRASRIAIYRQGAIADSEQTLEAIRDWTIERLLRFRDVFGPRIAEIAESDDQPSLP